MSTKQGLPSELKNIVRFAIDELGNTIKLVYGKDTFDLVEKIRKQMALSRDVDEKKLYQILSDNLGMLKKLSSKKHYEIAHSFSLYMEIINRCESAYRQKKLEIKPIDYDSLTKPYSIIFVFTAHPTEARSQMALNLFKQIEIVLRKKLEHPENNGHELALKHLLMLLIRLPLSTQNKPTVKDEASNLFNVIFRHDLLLKQIELKRKNVNIQFRTWVGGDKDGHPYVDQKTMLDSWQLSRDAILNFIQKEIDQSSSLISNLSSDKKVSKLINDLLEFKKSLKDISKVAFNDGKKIVAIRARFEKLHRPYEKYFKVPCPHLENITDLFWLYPAMVIPLEIREDSALVKQALKDKNMAISKMLEKLRAISGGKLEKWYVRGFVLSMANESSDVISGYKLIKKCLSSYAIPVVPLFETRVALENGVKILTEAMDAQKTIEKTHKDNWGSRFEVMLGYSDSSKENGVLSSRILINDSISKLDKFLNSKKLVPVFFHGSGGSVERGGGSIKEQTSWWPKSALNIYKSTIQGEMVSRNFGNPLIMDSMVSKIVQNFSSVNDESTSVKQSKLNHTLEFANNVSNKYQDFLNRDDFAAIIKSVTPYAYLDQLKIGSRPTKRQKQGQTDEIKLRAIPWVLCWTQTRILFPTWWGIGSVWDELTPAQKLALSKEVRTNELMGSFLKNLGFTLAKVELEIFHLYITEGLASKEAIKLYELFKLEYEKTLVFFQEMTTGKDLVWFRPWLFESIELRSPMIHPLNLLQIIALQKKDSELLRETVTGIACGMMTTG